MSVSADWEELSAWERDALVAEEVMGWEPCDGFPKRERRTGHNNYVAVCDSCGVRWPTWRSLVNEGKEVYDEVNERLRGAGVHPKLIGGTAPDIDAVHFENEYSIPDFTTDISAAWRVVEEMRRDGFLWRVQDYHFTYEGPRQIRHTFRSTDEEGPDFDCLGTKVHYVGETAESAIICLAALRAKDVDV